MPVLVIAEHDNARLKPVSLKTVTAAAAIGDDIHVLVAGSGCSAVADEAARIAGIARVVFADAAEYEHGAAENLAPLVVKLAPGYSHILAAATTLGKNLIPRAAAMLDVQPVSDVCAIEATDRFVRPVYAGNALATVRSGDAIKMMTVRTTAFDAAAADGGTAAIDPVTATGESGLSLFLSEELTRSDRPELTSARIIVAGGRGLQSGENFALLEGIADKLGGAVAATRAAVDAGYVSNDYQVGQTGKVVAPELYIAVGISGAIQHLAGMKDSKVIVAINKDEEAPIFQVADYGLVADLFQAVPELQQELDKA